MTEKTTAETLILVGWYCWRCEGLNAQACRSDCVPIHVPAEWVDDMAREIRRLEDEDDEQDAAVDGAGVVKKTPEDLRAQRAELIASTGLTEEVLRERAEAFQLYPEHMDAWQTVEGIDYLLAGVEPDLKLAEAEAQARGWEEKYFQLVEKHTPIAQRDAALQGHLRVLRRAVEALPAKCRYHDDTVPYGTWREACCDTGMPARRRMLAEQALDALDKRKGAQG